MRETNLVFMALPLFERVVFDVRLMI